MAEQFQLGISTFEGVKNVVNTSVDISTRNVGVLMERERGVANTPILFTTLREDSLLWGGKNNSMYSPFVVQNLFDNLQGINATLYGVRIVGDGSVAASCSVAETNAADTSHVVATVDQAAGASQNKIVTYSFNLLATDETAAITILGVTASTKKAAGETDTVIMSRLYQAFANHKANFSASPLAAVTIVDNGAGTMTVSAVDNNNDFATSVKSSADADELLTVSAGRQGVEDMGTWGNGLTFKLFPIAATGGYTDKIYFVIYLNGEEVQAYAENTLAELISTVNAQSDYVYLTEGTATAASGVFTATVEGCLNGGIYVAPVEADFEPGYDGVTGDAEGLQIFESVDVQIIMCPEIQSTDFAIKAKNYATAQKQMYVHSATYNMTESAMNAHHTSIVTSQRANFCQYLQWVQVDDASGGKIWIPGIGYAIGAGFIRNAGLNKGYVWTPPAGIETTMQNVYDVTHPNLSDQTIDRYVKQYKMNIFKYIKGTGYVIWSSRTISSDVLYHSIHVSLETNYLLAALAVRNTRFIQRLATASFAREVYVDNDAFFRVLYDEGGIEQSVDYSKAVVIEFYPSPGDRKNWKLEVSWIPPETTEAIKITLNRNDGVLSLEG